MLTPLLCRQYARAVTTSPRTPAPAEPARSAPIPVAVLISGTGSNLAALLDAHHESAPYRVTAVLADLDAPGLEHARARGIPVRVVRPADHPTREAWDEALTAEVEALEPRPRLIVLAGFMRLLGAPLLDAFPGAIINTHPALLPSFPGAHGVRDALAYGVRITGASLIEVDAGVDTGRILAQRAVEVREGDDESSLHERIKEVEREMLIEQVSAITACMAQEPPAQG